tara:strand:+ start:366 stop:629 length:264 start_codon:yes stop_codon:yes gene_type:complete
MKNIEDLLFPNNRKLIINKEEDCLETCIVDIEIDPIDCTFIGDGCIKINTEDLTYIMLDFNNLYDMLDLIDQADSYYEKEYNNTKNK